MYIHLSWIAGHIVAPWLISFGEFKGPVNDRPHSKPVFPSIVPLCLNPTSQTCKMYINELESRALTLCAGGGGGRNRRVMTNRQSAQRSRSRKLQYVSDLEAHTVGLQKDLADLQPQVALLKRRHAGAVAKGVLCL